MNRNMNRRLLATLLAVGSMTVGSLAGMSAMAAPASAAVANKSPLVFGSIQTNTGASALPEEGQAIQATVDYWNAHGGYNGHPIKVIAIDASDSTSTANAARQLVQTDHILAFINNYDESDCASNASFDQQNGVPVVDSEATSNCYKPVDLMSSKIPTTVGMSVGVKWAASKGVTEIGMIYPQIPGISQTISALASYVQKTVHHPLVRVQVPITATAADLDGAIVKLKAAHVKATFALLPVPGLALQEAKLQSYGPAQGIRWLFPSFGAVKASSLQGGYVTTLTLPFGTSNPQVKTAQKILKGKVSSYDQFTAVGYQAVTMLQQILARVKGPVTRSSILTAARGMKRIPLALTGGVLYTPTNPSVNPEGGLITVAEGNKFVVVSPYYVTNY